MLLSAEDMTVSVPCNGMVIGVPDGAQPVSAPLATTTLASVVGQ